MTNPSHVRPIGAGRVASRAVVAVCTFALSFSAIAADFSFNHTVTRIAFGSCNMPQVAQPIWSPVLASHPDIWIWTGDVIYADTDDVAKKRDLYALQSRYPAYRRLRETVPVLGTWDDHDYGRNNVGIDYGPKDESQSAFLDFLKEPASSLRRRRKGIYGSYLYGRTGERLKVVLLDTRYHREPPGPKADMLGSEQWMWLESELSRRDADLVVLVSSTNVLAYERGHMWAAYPKSREHLYRMIGRSAAPVVILSGDIHFGEISKLQWNRRPWPLLEITASGMTHSAITASYANPFREGSLYPGLNFGVMKIQWKKTTVRVTLEIRDTDGMVRTSASEIFKRPGSGQPPQRE